jgi:molybdate transport system substrate-binding protein
MRKLMIRWLLHFAAVLFLTAAILSACSGKQQEGKQQKVPQTVLLVSAASSLKDSLERIVQSYESLNENIRIQLNFASSGTLQQQIEQGAPADLFLSAGRKQMEVLQEKGLVRESHDVLANELVLILSSDYAGRDVTEADRLLNADLQHIAIGEPDSVPAGIYARQALTSLGLWDKLSSRLVYARDVRHVLTLVETGNADAGIVYRTDVQAGDQVRLAFAFPPEAYDPIVYPFGVISQSEHLAEAEAFMEYLKSEEALRIFRDYGFRQP